MCRIMITGDKHGDRYEYQRVMHQIDNPRETDKIIVCGDAGLSYGDFKASAAKKAMKKFPGSWIIMRGNHDDRYWAEACNIEYDEKTEQPIKWVPKNNSWIITDDGMYIYQKKYPNIFYVYDDGGIYTIGDYNFLFIPGAYSVDKYYRLERNLPYNPDEQLTKAEQERLFNLVKYYNQNRLSIDFVIGHTFPLHIEPYYRYLFLDFIDQNSVDKSMEKFLQALSYDFEQNKAFKQYFGGHFHTNKELNDKYTMLYHDIVEVEDYL